MSSGRRWLTCRNSPYVGHARLALTTVLALLAACGDTVLPSEQPTPSIDSPRFGPTCGTICVTLPGPIPGAFSAVLGRGDSATGRDSVLWATSYPTRSTVKLTVSGRLTRKYTMNTMPAWAAYRGTNYFSLDADGEFTSSQCWGHIVTDFKLPNGNAGGWVRACRTSNNNPPADGVQTFSSIGIVSGAGYVKRWSQFQPSVPGYTNCMSGPCVFVTGGSQTITIEPWANNLVLAATPDSIAEGDSVSFAASAGGLAMSVQGWTWVPDSVAGASGPTVDTRTGTCQATQSQCTIPVFHTGTMFVRAFVGTGSSQTLEQASKRVKVTPKPPRLVVACSSPVTRGSTQSCSAYAVDFRGQRIPFLMTLQSARERDSSLWAFSEPLSTTYGSQGTHQWAGTVARSTVVTMVAEANNFQISDSATFSVTPRTWAAWAVSNVVETTQLYPPQIVDPLVGGGTVGGFHAVDPSMFNPSNVDSITSGPNQGVSFFRQRLPNPVGRIYIHPALYPGHAFFADQNGVGSGTCTAADVVVFRSSARRHEGVGLQRNSHVGVADSVFAQYRPDSTIFELAARRQNKYDFLDAAYNRYRDWVTIEAPWRPRQDAFDLADYPVVWGSISCTLDFNLNDAG